jgi:superfamily II DNA/RNA helicase
LPEICDALERVGIVEPFPIQEMTLPIALMGTDLIGQARTGTGKTLGFGIPLLQRTISPGEPDYEELAAPGKPQALVVTPTRELTIQVAKDLETASTVRTVRVLTIYGGVAYEPQLDQLKKGVDVVVGTPGRLLDLANRGVLDLSHIKVLVLDEADEMLDLGFLPDVERILRKTPELRQTMLFSATMPSAVIALARTHMRHPLNIRAESHESTQMVPTTAQFVYRAHDLDKPEVVARILQAEDRGRVMIFCRTKREASRLTDDLVDRGFKAAAIHGDLNQQARERALTRFRGDKIDVLICTDVAARGIDVEGVTHVVNNTCPEDEKAYIHRIGRTGRAGASGIAVTFVDWPDVIRWKTINKALDLPYDEPQEIYSTSPELYHDLGIPTDAKGRIKPAREEKPEREEKPRREQTARRTEGEEAGDRSARSKRNRSRRRTRSGRPLEGVVGEGTEQAEEKSEADVTAKTQVPPTPESSTEAAEVAQSTERKPRQRSRRRRTSEAADAPTTGATTTGAAGTTAAGAPETAAAGSTEAAPVAEATAAVEVATETKPADAAAEVEGSAEAKPAKRTRSRTRKTAEPKPTDTEASAPESAPAEASAPESAPAEVDAPAKAPAKKATRARKTAKASAPTEEKPAAEAAPVEEKPATKAAPAEKKPAKKAATATKKTAAKTATAEEPAATAKAATAEKKAAKAPAPRTAPTIPTFTAPK